MAALRRVFQFRSMRDDLETELDAEIHEHLRRTREELRATGFSAVDAQREAERRFGNMDRHRLAMRRADLQRGRKARRSRLVSATLESLRYATRCLRASPGVTLTVVATIALGVGANATMFGIIDRLLLSPPEHVVDAEDVVRLHVQRTFLGRLLTGATISYLDYRDFVGIPGLDDVVAVSNVPGGGM